MCQLVLASRSRETEKTQNSNLSHRLKSKSTKWSQLAIGRPLTVDSQTKGKCFEGNKPQNHKTVIINE